MFKTIWHEIIRNEGVLEWFGILGSIAGIDLKHPVFIVGTGRCGTSLLIHILASHPEICVFPNEANHLWHPLLYPLEKLENNPLGASPYEMDPDLFTCLSRGSWTEKHTKRIRNIFRGFWMANNIRRTLIVKSAMISFMIKDILTLFPNAKFLHIYRYGPAVVESYFRKNYTTYSNLNCTEEEYRLICARYWNSCILEIDRAREYLFGNENERFVELSYENLCDSPMKMLKKIALFIGVETEGFTFDCSTIASQNWKNRDLIDKREWEQPLLAMVPALKSKRYI